MTHSSNTCPCCWKERDRWGSLTDPNGKTWKICAECINDLWHLHDDAKQIADVTDEEYPSQPVVYLTDQDRQTMVDDVIRLLRERLTDDSV